MILNYQTFLFEIVRTPVKTIPIVPATNENVYRYQRAKKKEINSRAAHLYAPSGETRSVHLSAIFIYVHCRSIILTLIKRTQMPQYVYIFRKGGKKGRAGADDEPILTFSRDGVIASGCIFLTICEFSVAHGDAR